MKKIITYLAPAFLALIASASAVAAGASPDVPQPRVPVVTSVVSAAAPEQAMATGEIRKVNLDTNKLTIKHGPIANLDMPGMTMVFTAANPEMLIDLKPGDKIRFQADSVKGTMTVISLEKVAKPDAPAHPRAQGQVEKIDKAARMLTVKYGPHPNINLPDMSFDFKVNDLKMLENLKDGDKIEFRADRINEALTLTELVRVN